MPHRLFRAAGIAAVAFAACLGSAVAQTQTPSPGAGGIKRTILQQFDVPGSAYETMIELVEIGPNWVGPKHTRLGIDSGVLQSGDFFLTLEGKSQQAVKPGDSWQIPPNTVHWGKAGPNGARVINIYVGEKGKPFATPWPAPSK